MFETVMDDPIEPGVKRKIRLYIVTAWWADVIM
jgi:hypothetical protein